MGKKPLATLEQFKAIMKRTIKADIDDICEYKPMLLEGPAGIGKTSVIIQGVKELEQELGQPIGFFQFDVGTRSANDLWGVPFPVDNKNGEKELKWIKEASFPQASDRDLPEIGIFFITELTSMKDEQMKVAILDLLSNRKMVGYELPKKWFIVCDGNRRQDGNVYAPLPFPARNRMSIFEAVFNSRDWIEYITHKAKFNEILISFLKTLTNDDIMTFDPSLEVTHGTKIDANYVCATPRSWEGVSEVTKMYINQYGMNFDREIIDEMTLMFSSMIGDELGKKYSMFLMSEVVRLKKLTAGAKVNIGEIEKVGNNGNQNNEKGGETSSLMSSDITNNQENTISNPISTNLSNELNKIIEGSDNTYPNKAEKLSWGDNSETMNDNVSDVERTTGSTTSNMPKYDIHIDSRVFPEEIRHLTVRHLDFDVKDNVMPYGIEKLIAISLTTVTNIIALESDIIRNQSYKTKEFINMIYILGYAMSEGILSEKLTNMSANIKDILPENEIKSIETYSIVNNNLELISYLL